MGWVDSGGTGIDGMVRATNAHTGWDNADRGGRYLIRDVSNWGFDKWRRYYKQQVGNHRAPVILHPQLRTEWFSYLDENGSGHFQVGRGYDTYTEVDKANYFEPFNQQRFDPQERFIGRNQERNMVNSYRANLDHAIPTIGL